jgi:hypothetical protein
VLLFGGLVLAAGGVLVGGVVAAPLAGASPMRASGTPRDVLTPLVAYPLSSPRPVRGADNRVHVVYELFVINPTTSVMRLKKLETLDASTHDSVIDTEHGAHIISTLGGGDVDSATRPLDPESALTLGPSQVSRLFLDATFAPKARLPRRLEHRFFFTLTSAEGKSSKWKVVSGRTRVVNESPVVIAPPLAGARWIVAGGCCFPASYHRTATLAVNGAFHASERFAIDFMQLGADNTLFSGPDTDLHSYKTFGNKLLSVAHGVVVHVTDGLPEQTPTRFPPPGMPLSELNGNYLVIKIGHRRFAFYAHMQPHSVRVHVGEHVTPGQVIGLLGNTGNTDAPHLHFQIMNGPDSWTADGLPFEFRSFGSEGTFTNKVEDLQKGKPAVIGPVNRGHHRSELPLENEVISFPGEGKPPVTGRG